MSANKRNLLPAIGLLFLFLGCSPRQDDAVEITTVGNDKVAIIHVDQISDQVEVKLTDLLDDLRFIPLEANDQCMFDYAMRVYVGKEYILISTINKGILMFDQNGKFLSNLATHGKGPGELMDANRNIFVDEKNNRLYVTDFSLMKDRMIVYDIKSGHYNIIPIAHQGKEIGIRDIIVSNDSIMYITTMQVRGGKSDCPLFCQTTSGKLLWEIKKVNPLGITDATIQLASGKIFMNYLFIQDTTWLVEGDQLKPVLVITTELPRAFLEEKVGNGYVGLNPVTDNLFLGSQSFIKSVEYDERYQSNRSTYSDRQSFTYDVKSRRARSIGEVKNDFLGSNVKFYPQYHHNGLATVTYQAIDLLEIADSVSKLPNINKELKKRLDGILETVGENDNPVLLVGKIKDL